MAEDNRTEKSAWRAIDFQAKARFLLHERIKPRLQPTKARQKNATRRAGGSLCGRPRRFNLRLEMTNPGLNLALTCYEEITRGH